MIQHNLTKGIRESMESWSTLRRLTDGGGSLGSRRAEILSKSVAERENVEYKEEDAYASWSEEITWRIIILLTCEWIKTGVLVGLDIPTNSKSGSSSRQMSSASSMKSPQSFRGGGFDHGIRGGLCAYTHSK